MSNYILASQSPRRKQLLEWAEMNFEVIISNADESYPPSLKPEEVAIYISYKKAIAVQKLQTAKTIIAADTIVVLNNEILGKPTNREEAISILSKLSGKKHEVITGVTILAPDKQIEFFDSTEVEFNSLRKEEIEFYVDKYQPYDKAGAYAIQEWIGVIGINSIKGDFYNVMGLPVSKVIKHLKENNL